MSLNKEALLDFLKANNAPENLVSPIESLKTVDLESVKEFLENDENGKKYLQSQKDAAVTKGIDTFKEKSLPNLIEEEIKVKFPAETAEQKKARELESKLTKLESELKRKELLTTAMSRASELKLPTKFIDRFIGEDEESTIANINEFSETYSEAISKAVESKFVENGREAPQGGSSSSAKKEYTSFDEWKADNAI